MATSIKLAFEITVPTMDGLSMEGLTLTADRTCARIEEAVLREFGVAQLTRLIATEQRVWVPKEGG